MDTVRGMSSLWYSTRMSPCLPFKITLRSLRGGTEWGTLPVFSTGGIRESRKVSIKNSQGSSEKVGSEACDGKARVGALASC